MPVQGLCIGKKYKGCKGLPKRPDPALSLQGGTTQHLHTISELATCIHVHRTRIHILRVIWAGRASQELYTTRRQQMAIRRHNNDRKHRQCTGSCASANDNYLRTTRRPLPRSTTTCQEIKGCVINRERMPWDTRTTAAKSDKALHKAAMAALAAMARTTS